MRLATVIILTSVLSGCSAPPSETANDSKPTPTLSLEQQYIQDLDNVELDYFLSDSAALSYLKQFCETKQTVGIGELDAIDQVVNSYCETELAADLGVKPQPEPTTKFDEAEFIAKAMELDPTLFETLSDGSRIDPVIFGKSLCNRSDTDQMIENLGSDWDRSFQKLALETFCPTKLD
jgi:hypothetical protein